jgi:hypothetical protein
MMAKWSQTNSEFGRDFSATKDDDFFDFTIVTRGSSTAFFLNCSNRERKASSAVGLANRARA